MVAVMVALHQHGQHNRRSHLCLDQFLAGIRERSQLGIEQAGVGTILGPRSQVGIEQAGVGTILGQSTILGAERWFQSLLRFALVPFERNSPLPKFVKISMWYIFYEQIPNLP